MGQWRIYVRIGRESGLPEEVTSSAKPASQPPSVLVPVSLLCNPSLTSSAKLIAIARRLQGSGPPPSLRTFGHSTGLNKSTVHRALAALATYPQSTTGPFIDLPIDLLTQSSVGVGARLLYGHLQLTPGFVHPTGTTTYACLQASASMDLKTVRRALHQLVEAGWIIAQQPNQNRPIQFELRHPRLDQGVRELALVKHRLSWGEFRGESLMREYLSLLIDDAHFEDNAAPGFLVNPITNQRLQFDRYYPPGVAFEFNGPQHYVQTDRHPAPEVAEQRARDLMKKGLCQEQGIELVVVHARHLSLKGMQAKVGTLLPLRQLSGLEPVIVHLEYESKRYRRSPSVHPPARR